MATSVCFRKFREDQTEVEYEWGDTPTSTDRRLTIDLHTMYAQAQRRTRHHPFDACARRISVLYRQTGRWPEKGGAQH